MFIYLFLERYEEIKRLEIKKSYGEFWGVWLVKSGACVGWGRVNRAWAVYHCANINGV